MKSTRKLIACALLFAFAGLTSVHAVEEGRKDGKATVRSIHGTVTYLGDDNQWHPVKPNMRFGPGVTFKTGPDGTADISINGTASAVRMTNSTTLQIPTMSYIGNSREGDTSTMLNLKTGAILGNVKKISANSRYEVMTPHGVAGIRGTDFNVEVVPLPNGDVTVKFDSITGVITVSAIVNGATVVHTLTSGTSWEVGKTPQQMSAAILANFQVQLTVMATTVEAAINAAVGGPRNTVINGGSVNINGANPTTPFTGGPPQGPPSSPTPQPAPPQGPGASPS